MKTWSWNSHSLSSGVFPCSTNRHLGQSASPAFWRVAKTWAGMLLRAVMEPAACRVAFRNPCWQGVEWEGAGSSEIKMWQFSSFAQAGALWPFTQHGGNMFLNKILGVHWLSAETEGDKCLSYLFQFYCTEKRFMLEFSGTSSCGFWERVITHSRAYLMLMKVLDFKEISHCQVVPQLSVVGFCIEPKGAACSWLQVFQLNSALSWSNSGWKVDYPF